MYNSFIRPFSLSKSIRTSHYFLKKTSFNLTFLELFKKLGLTSSFSLVNNSSIQVNFLLNNFSMLYNNFYFFKKKAFKFVFSKDSLDFFSKNTKSMAIVSNDLGYSISSNDNQKGGKLVMIYSR